MPIATDPSQTFRVVLKTDQAKPENERPAFEFRHMTLRQWRQAAAGQDSIEQVNNTGEALDIILELIGSGLVNWHNMMLADGTLIPFDLKELDNLLTLNEAHELLDGFLNQAPTVGELKKFASPSPCNSENSAESANPANV